MHYILKGDEFCENGKYLKGKRSGVQRWGEKWGKILSRVIKIGFIEKVTFKQRLEGHEGDV